jgi:AcrR family transcriptional regulator
MARVTDTRARIVRAAEDVVVRDGVSRLTLEAAAAEAGVSKGGVLYHFPTRAALVTAMVCRFVESFDADLEHLGAYSGETGAFARAYLEATLAPTVEPGDVHNRRLGGALLAGVAADPELLAPLRERFDAWQRAVEHDGLAPGVGSLVRLAADGLWLSDLFDLAPLQDKERERIAKHLRTLIGTSTRRKEAR